LDPNGHAPKLAAIVNAVVNDVSKSLILAQVSYKVILELLLEASAAADPPFHVATMDKFMEFNSQGNANGEEIRVMIAKPAQCGEGISFKEVRHVHIVEPPWSHTNFAQLCGRAVRVHSHARLPPDRQSVRFMMYVATVPTGTSADELAVRHLRKHARGMGAALRRFRASALESAAVAGDPGNDQQAADLNRPEEPLDSRWLRRVKLGVSQHWFEAIARGDKRREFRAATDQYRRSILQAKVMMGESREDGYIYGG